MSKEVNIMAVSTKIERFITQASWIRKMFEDGIRLKAEHGADKVYDFTLGNPNVAPPPEFHRLLREMAGRDIPGKHGYMPNAGYMETRRAVADYVGREHGLPLKAEHVVMTCGAGGALNVIFKTLLDPGDEVVIPKPYFVEYQFYVDNHSGITRLVETRQDFSLDFDRLRDALTEKTKAVLINSPNNPTGKVYDQPSIDGLASLLKEKQKQYGREIYLVSDEPYSQIVYDGVVVPSVLKAYPNSFIATSHSKNISIPGERIGHIAVHPGLSGVEKVMDGLILSNRILGFVNAPALMQRIVAELQGVVVDLNEYRRKRDRLCEGLSSLGYRFEEPKGAFYLFPESPIPDDVAFVRILQKYNVLTVPGTGFGGPGHFRIAYCVDDATIANAMEGFSKAMKEARDLRPS
jgi:aspartate aminotransferase